MALKTNHADHGPWTLVFTFHFRTAARASIVTTAEKVSTKRTGEHLHGMQCHRHPHPGFKGSSFK